MHNLILNFYTFVSIYIQRSIQFKFVHIIGWGPSRFDANIRPHSPQHLSSCSRISAESSSESEVQSTISASSAISSGSKDKEKKSGMFRLFSKKKRSSQSN